MQHQKTHRAGKTRSVVKNNQTSPKVKNENRNNANNDDEDDQQQYIVTGSEGTQYMVYATDADSAREAVEAQHGGTAGQVVQLSSEEANAILANVEKDQEEEQKQQQQQVQSNDNNVAGIAEEQHAPPQHTPIENNQNETAQAAF